MDDMGRAAARSDQQINGQLPQASIRASMNTKFGLLGAYTVK